MLTWKGLRHTEVAPSPKRVYNELHWAEEATEERRDGSVCLVFALHALLLPKSGLEVTAR